MDETVSRHRSAIGRPDTVAGRFYVGFKSRPGAAERGIVQSHGAAVKADLSDLDAFEIEAGSQANLAGLAAHGNVAYVEPVPMRYASGLSTTQLAPSLSNGLYGLLTTKATLVHAAGNTGAGIKACVADTSLDASHPDIAARYAGGRDTVGACTDTAGGAACATAIVDDGETHGTHVAGTIVGDHNEVGVYGVAYGASLYHARVLGPTGGTTTDIIEGVRWLKDQGCQVVNLSLGGGLKSRTEENFYKAMRAAGVIVVAATGNDSAKTISFPAGYAVNISVGAVDRNNLIADFSNRGKGIDVVAPGVGVLSSVRMGTGSESSVTAGERSPTAFGLEFAARTAGTTGTLVDCGLGDYVCTAAAGQIALIQRGTIDFATKVQNAKAGGAVAVIIYNNVAGDFTGTLGAAGDWIPAVSISDTAGAELKAQLGIATVVDQASDWDHYDGTSMATPHVTGVIALMWAKYGGSGKAAADAIEQKLKASCTNLGAAGYDTTYGYGLVDAQKSTSP